jgi:predicted nucleotidyltransferase
MPNQVTDAIATTLFGQTRRNVLGLLFGRPDQDFYLREVVRHTGAGMGAVQREVAALTEAGLITRTPRGKHVYFQANRQSPVFDELRSLIDKTAGVADVVRATLQEVMDDGRIELAFIYGSVATGKQGPESDVDLMIVGGARLSELVPAIRVAEDRLGREINPTVFRLSEIQERLRAHDHFISRTFSGPKIMLIGSDDDIEQLARTELPD